MNLSPIQRYVPLLCWVVVIATCLFMGLKIISYGFLPPGDARRHVAKALTNKEYTDIVVLRPEYTVDHSPGWDWFLKRVHAVTGWGEDGSIAFSVVSMLCCVLFAPMPWLKRPEAWLAALLVQLVALPDLMLRLTQGRPYLLSEMVLICILFAWSKEDAKHPSWHKIVLTFIGITLSVWVHGAWYLWAFVLAAFFLAGAWRQTLWLAGCWVGAIIAGGLLSGKPFAFLYGSVFMAESVYKEHAPAWMLVGEFQPSDGEFYTLAVVALVYLWRRQQNKIRGDLLRQPVFWMAMIGWTLGFKADRFWADWGLPATTVWLAMQFDDALETLWPADSLRRLMVCAVVIAAPLFLDSTSDVRVRYTFSLQEAFVDGSKPELAGWMPDEGGIFYSAEMAFFYNTFYKNPYGNWRYILAYEPALMPPDDLKIYREIQRSRYDWNSYKPWIDKMRPQDRLEIAGNVQPVIPELEWKQAARGIWIGRLPRTKPVK